jgi:signal peptidase II
MKEKLKLLRPNPSVREFVALAVVAVLVAVDQITKWLIVRSIPCMELPSCNELPIQGDNPMLRFGEVDIIGITHIHNEGAAFGILSGQQTLLIAVTSVALLGAVVAILTGRIRDKWLLASIVMIIGGGIGNLIDRVRLDYVVDFIQLHFVRFAVFNVADVFAVAGAILMCLAVIAEEMRAYRAKRACGVGDFPEASKVSETLENLEKSED